MTHVRSKAVVALVAALLASCTGVAPPQASGPAETPQQASEVPHTPAPAQAPAEAVVVADAGAANARSADGAGPIVVTGSRMERRDYNSATPIVTVTESNLDRLPQSYAP